MDNIPTVAAEAEHRFRAARDRYHSVVMSNSTLRMAHTKAIIHLTWLQQKAGCGSLSSNGQEDIIAAQTQISRAEERVKQGLKVAKLAMVNLDVAERDWLAEDLQLTIFGYKAPGVTNIPSRKTLVGDDFIKAWSNHVSLSRSVIDSPLPGSSGRPPPAAQANRYTSQAPPKAAAQAAQSKPQAPPLPNRSAARLLALLSQKMPEDRSLPSIETIAKYFDDVEAAFADYSKIQSFPKPPAWRCDKPSCGLSRTSRYLDACECNIRYVFEHREDPKAERLRFHPDRFAKCPEPFRIMVQKMAKEIFVVVDQMSRGL